MGPTIDTIALEYSGKAKIGKLNVDENGQTAMRYNVRGIPTLLLFKGGKLLEQRVERWANLKSRRCWTPTCKASAAPGKTVRPALHFLERRDALSVSSVSVVCRSP